MNPNEQTDLSSAASDALKANETPNEQAFEHLEVTKFEPVESHLPANREPPTVSPPQLDDRYIRAELHDQGGMGRIWVVRDTSLDRDIALKELHPEFALNTAALARFLREAKVTGQLEHPGVVPVYELARPEDGRAPFYTMRFVRGRTSSKAAMDYHLKLRAGQEDSLAMAALLHAFVMVCNTVGYAHSRGVIHRDLKGQNVIMGDFGEVVVLDWGLAKLLGNRDSLDEAMPDAGGYESDNVNLTMQGQTLGTPASMAPEQAAGRLDQIDHRTDIYGLGAILYEILTGQPPFTGTSTREVLRMVQEEAPQRLGVSDLTCRTVWRRFA